MPATTTRYTGVATRHSGDTILAKLKKLDTSFRTRWLALLIAGALVSMIGPVIFGTATFIRQYRAGGVGIGVEQEPWLHHVGYACLWILAGRLNRQRRADRALAAAMLAELLNRGDGLPIGEVFKVAQDRGDSAFSAALAYLMFHDLVDVSKTGDRVWVCSDGKRALGVG